MRDHLQMIWGLTSVVDEFISDYFKHTFDILSELVSKNLYFLAVLGAACEFLLKVTGGFLIKFNCIFNP